MTIEHYTPPAGEDPEAGRFGDWEPDDNITPEEDPGPPDFPAVKLFSDDDDATFTLPVAPEPQQSGRRRGRR